MANLRRKTNAAAKSERSENRTISRRIFLGRLWLKKSFGDDDDDTQCYVSRDENEIENAVGKHDRISSDKLIG
jgi:hypothetical protein